MGTDLDFFVSFLTCICVPCGCTFKSPHVWESKTVLDSGFHFVDSGFQVLYSTSSVEPGFWILDSGF